jgi:prenyl protein peptidase
MGLYPLALVSTLKTLLLTALLFLGPLFESLIVDASWRELLHLETWAELWSDPTTNRNLIAGPITEEILFRTASIPLMLLSQAGIRTTVFFSPVIFGLAHFHHFYEFRLSYPGVPIFAALLRSVFQLGFTSVFGAYATFIYVRTGSLLAVCAVHAFCNTMGLPRVWGKVRRIGIEDARKGEADKGWMIWTVAYYVLLVGGAVAFWKHLWAFTESKNALVPGSVFGRH